MSFVTREIDETALVQLLDQHKMDRGAWLYHRLEWLKAVADGLGFRVYGLLTEMGDGGVAALTPLMETRKAFLKLVGSPLRGSHTEFLGPLFAKGLDDESRRGVLAALHAHLKGAGASYIEWGVRDDAEGGWDALSSLGYEKVRKETMILNLDGDAGEAWKGFQGRARNMIRKAEKSGVTVRRVVPDATNIAKYYTMLLETFGRQGLKPAHPLRLYQAMGEGLSPHQWLHLLVAEHEGEWVASAIFLTYGERMVYLSGVSNDAGRRLAANSLLQWEAIKMACERGIAEYDLGGTGNAAIDKFKASFGGRPHARHGWVYRSPLAAVAERVYLAMMHRGAA